MDKTKNIGWVYVFTNTSMPGLVKIGYTSKHPKVRANELQTTGVPHPFVAEFGIRTNNPQKVERKVHAHFKKTGHHEAKEFFNCHVEEAISAVRTFSKNVYDKFTLPLEGEQEEQSREIRIEEQQKILAKELARKKLEKEKKRRSIEQERIRRGRKQEIEKCVSAIESSKSNERSKIVNRHSDIFENEEKSKFEVLSKAMGGALWISLFGTPIVIVSSSSDPDFSYFFITWLIVFCVVTTILVQFFNWVKTKSKQYINREKRKVELLAPLDRLFPASIIPNFSESLPYGRDSNPPFLKPLPPEKVQKIIGKRWENRAHQSEHHIVCGTFLQNRDNNRVEFWVKNENIDWMVVLLVLRQKEPYSKKKSAVRVPVCVLPMSSMTAYVKCSSAWPGKLKIIEAYGYQIPDAQSKL